MNFELIEGDADKELAKLSPGSVDCVVTSPPYWGHRNYGDSKQLGLEASPFLYVSRLVSILHKLKRVMKPTATLWLNLGDTYMTAAGKSKVPGGKQQYISEGGGHPETPPQRIRLSGFRQKSLIGIPWRVAFAMQADGWILRSEIIWEKPNAKPESVKDRPTTSHEHLFLLSLSERYFYEIDAVRAPHLPGSESRSRRGRGIDHKYTGGQESARPEGFHTDASKVCHPKGKNIRTVWNVPITPYKGAHFATFPKKLVEPCIRAGCPAGGTVLDPFCGTGTTGRVAIELGRKFIGIDVSAGSLRQARERICATT